MVGWHLNHWRILVLVSIQGSLGGAVEKRHQLIILRLLDRVVFVRVAARADHCHAEEHSAKRFGTVEVVLGLKFRRNHAAFRGCGVHPYETGGNKLFHRRVGQKVAGQLPFDELVKRQVFVECAHYPVAVGIDAALVVEVQSVCVAIADGVEPVTCLVFAITGITEKFFNQTLICIFIFILEVGFQQSRLGRQAG